MYLKSAPQLSTIISFFTHGKHQMERGILHDWETGLRVYLYIGITLSDYTLAQLL